MNRDPDNEQLLRDILAESAPADFRAAMLGETLRLARGRRRSRQWTRAGILALTVLVAVLFWKLSSRPPKIAQQSAPRAVPRSYTLIPTMPLPATAIITTQSSPPQPFAISEPVHVIETTAGNFQFINDNELLAMLNPGAAILVRTGPQSQELVFANSEGPKN